MDAVMRFNGGLKMEDSCGMRGSLAIGAIGMNEKEQRGCFLTVVKADIFFFRLMLPL